MRSLLEKILNAKILFCIVYKLIIDLFFSVYLSDTYSYCGSGASLNSNKYIVSWLMLFVLLVIRELIINQDMSFIIEILYYLSIVPTLSIYWMKNENTYAMLLIFCYWIVFEIFAGIFSREKHINCVQSIMYSHDKLKKDNIVIQFIFIWCVISILYFSWKYGNFRFFVRFEDVYTYRLAPNNSMSSIGGYIFSWNTNLLIPLCMNIHLLNKKYLFTVIDIIMILLSYSIYGNKTILFTGMVVIGVWILSKIRFELFTDKIISLFLGCIMIVAMIFGNTVVYKWPASLLYRLLYIPSEAHFYYFDFFQKNELLYFRQSFLRFFASDPYNKPVSVLIGSDKKYNLVGSYNNLNNGLFSDAYMNFGVIGVMIFPIIIVVVLCVIIKALQSYEDVIRYSFFIVLLMYCISASLFTWLLSGGVILAIFIFNVIGQTGIHLGIAKYNTGG